MRRTVLFTLIATVVSLGIWHSAQGVWIYLKAEIAQYLLDLAWSNTLMGMRKVKPWPWADTWPVAKMFIPKHGVDLIILAHANGRTLAFGPGHESMSGPPGEMGTTILSGHRDTHFRFLKLLREGEQIIIQQPNGSLTPYAIQAIDIVNARRTTIHLDHTQNLLVLVTCYPFDALTSGGSLRYVVTALADEDAIGQ